MSELKCPFCQQKLDYDDLLGSCINEHCEESFDMVGTESLWQKVIDLKQEIDSTRKALDIAVDALKEQQRWFGVIRVSLISHLNNQYGTLFKSYDADPTVVNVKRANDILNTAIKKITALEQKNK